jgi:hypothetical protein
MASILLSYIKRLDNTVLQTDRERNIPMLLILYEQTVADW